MSDFQPGRRRALTFLGMSALALAWMPFRARAASKKRPEVIVIGAGLSGLYAAMLLEAEGAKVTILEASGRIGGRCFTFDDLPGRPDAGASRIPASAVRVRALCGKLGLALEDEKERLPAPALNINGLPMPLAAWPESPENRLQGALREQPPQVIARYIARNGPHLENPSSWMAADPALDDQTLDLYLRAFGATDEALRLAGAGMASDRLYELSALAYLRAEAQANAMQAGPASWIAGGMSRLPEAMTKTIKGKIRLESRVAAVDWTQGALRVTCVPEKAGKKGKVYKGTHAVLAVPPTVLRDLAFIPGLPEPLAGAVSALKPAPVAMAFFQTGVPFWTLDGLPSDMWSDGVFGRMSVAPADSGGWILSCSAHGSSAENMAALAVEAVEEYCLAALYKLRPSLAGQAQFLKAKVWNADPLAGGGEILWGAGQMRRFGQAFSASAGPLFFAGAHASVDFDGLEGALAAGETAARKLLTMA